MKRTERSDEADNDGFTPVASKKHQQHQQQHQQTGKQAKQQKHQHRQLLQQQQKKPRPETLAKQCASASNIGECPDWIRWLSCPQSVLSSPSESNSFEFTVVSFNILAQKLASSHHFPLSEHKHLRHFHRLPLMTRTLHHLNGDILCLQEVDMKDYDLDPQIKAIIQPSRHNNRAETDSDTAVPFSGYELKYGSAPGKKHGCVIMWKSKLFDLVAHEVIPLYGEEQQRSLQILESGGFELRTNNIAVAVVLRHKESNQTVVVTSAHLHWGLDASAHVQRLAQAFLLRRRAGELAKEYMAAAAVMAGDWNSQPLPAASPMYLGMTGSNVDILTTVNDEEAMKKLIPDYTMEDGSETIDNTGHRKHCEELLRQFVNLTVVSEDQVETKSACQSAYSGYSLIDPDHFVPWASRVDGNDGSGNGNEVENGVENGDEDRKDAGEVNEFAEVDASTGEPRFTTYGVWCGTLDYIFTSPSPSSTVRVDRVLALPDEKLLRPGMPNEHMCSDHVPIAANLLITF